MKSKRRQILEVEYMAEERIRKDEGGATKRRRRDRTKRAGWSTVSKRNVKNNTNRQQAENAALFLAREFTGRTLSFVRPRRRRNGDYFLVLLFDDGTKIHAPLWHSGDFEADVRK